MFGCAVADEIRQFLHDNDEEHWGIAVCLQQLMECCDHDSPPAVSDRLVRRLVLLCERHLRHEEAFLRAHGFPGLDRHIEGHDAMRDTLRLLLVAWRSGAPLGDGLIEAASVFSQRLLKDDESFREFFGA